ncbi:hypothetical protein [Euzebya rosea]|uniref:hypothetical protein n=1 Tax=Euzebya rosea TaxID=2052804 RepID=UPI000D3E2DB0|nr:hypothetical protein [Euzebya rosea]
MTDPASFLFGLLCGGLVCPLMLVGGIAITQVVERWRADRRPIHPHVVYGRLRGRGPGDRPVGAHPIPGRPVPLDLHPLLEGGT